MSSTFLDSSIVIGLHFRNRKERLLCESALPDGETMTSRYVIFEVSRGFLRSILLLHNMSFEYDSFAELHRDAHSGQARFQHYRMQTWLGAFDDYIFHLEAEDGAISLSAALAELRAQLRTWARRGWKEMLSKHTIVNEIGCREVQAPFVRSHDKRLDQILPDRECGTPSACDLTSYVARNASSLYKLKSGLESIKSIDTETARRIDALARLLNGGVGEQFEGKDCYRCGDALICHESPQDAVVASKNRKHFEPICNILGRASSFPEVSHPVD